MPVQRGIQQTGSRGHGQPFYQGAANQRGAAPPRPSGKDNFVSPGPLTVNVNCFEITNLPNILYYQYDVISPEIFNRARCSQIIDRLQNHVRPDIFQKRAIYDGRKILYAAKYPLQLVSSEGQSFTVNMSDTGSKIFTVKLSPINLDAGINVGIIGGADAHNQHQKAIEPTTVLQLLIQAAPNLGTSGHGMDIHQVRGARAYYTDVGALKIGGGLELWQGFFQLVMT
ncbi:hypothetical protein PILCRDRAFT_204190 [Piloderma croceum F 1598]|uniref:Protein argonaute N-terminal domain-containing protein n=1 Tax=Piloderma croceum (strain F 1598) TaxID=765440 RepID=A0A0C3BTV9_PILCF|nr:hypothetical protein PILCRDRAFT_204190 [Piloderma croceum F 1598]